MTDLTSKTFRLTIGGNDWSDYCTEATLQHEEIDLRDGLVKAKGKFILDVSELSPLPSYRRDPDQWAKGTPVLFEVKMGADWVTPRFGNLVISVPPKAPYIGNPFIELEAICVLSLFDYSQPDGDASNVTVGTPRDRQTIIADILGQNSITSSLTGVPYPLDYPTPKRQGSWVDQAGALAAVSGHYLYQDRDGIVKNQAIDLGAAAIATVTVGQNEAEWEPSEGPEQPVEKLIVSGVGYNVTQLNGETKIVETLGFRRDVAPEIQAWRDEYLGVIARTTITDNPYDPVTQSQTTLTVKEETRIAVFPDLSNFPSDSYFLTISEITEDVNYYGDQGQLIKQVCTKQRPKIKIRPNVFFFDRFVLTVAEIVVTEYFYDDALRVTALKVTETLPQTTIFPGIFYSQAFDLSTSKIEETTWTELGADRWAYIKSSQVAYAIRYPERPFFTEAFNLVPGVTQTYIADDGSGAPPQTQYLKLNDLTEVPLSACVNFTGPETDPYGDRSRTVPVEYAVNEDQLYSFGLLYNAFIWGRRFGWRVGLPVTTALLNAYPLDRVDVVDGADTYGLLIDGLTMVFTGQEAFAAFNGVEIAYNSQPPFTEIVTVVGQFVGGSAFAGSGETAGNVIFAIARGQMTGQVVVNQNSAAGNMTAIATFEGNNLPPVEVEGDMAAIAEFTGEAEFSIVASGDFVALATLAGNGGAVVSATGDMVAAAVFFGTNEQITLANGEMEAQAAFTGTGDLIIEASGSMVAEAIFEGVVIAPIEADGAMTAIAELAGDGGPVVSGSGDIAAEAQLTGTAAFFVVWDDLEGLWEDLEGLWDDVGKF